MSILVHAWTYLRKKAWLSAAVLAAIAGASLFEGASFGMLIPIIQSMIGKPSDAFAGLPALKAMPPFPAQGRGAHAVMAALAVFFVIVVLKNALSYAADTLIARLRLGIARDLSVDLVDGLVRYDMKFFDQTKAGYAINIITGETRRIGDFLMSALNVAALSFRMAAYIAVMLLISWEATAVISVIILVVLLPLEIVMKKIKRVGALVSGANAEVISRLTETLGGIRLVKSSGAEDLEAAAFRKVADAAFTFQYRNNRYILLRIPMTEVVILGLIISFFIAAIGFGKVDLAGSFPFIATYLVVLVKMLTQLNQVNGMRSSALSNVAACVTYESMRDERGKKSIASGGRVPAKLADGIELRGVSFSYGDAPVLRGVDATIGRGRTTAIVGESGAGKSTLVNLIMRFYDPTAGALLVDGIDLRELRLDLWRRMIGFVSQDVFMFNASVAYNIAYGNAGVPEERIRAAARMANADDFIMSLPQGYGTLLGDRGVRLSGGQRQRISIARAVIHDPVIIILDEATSSLDAENERLVKESLSHVARDRTVIAIAHRLSTVMNADNIIVLDKGAVVESGRHDDLIGKGGFYKKLCATQLHAYSGAPAEVKRG